MPDFEDELSQSAANVAQRIIECAHIQDPELDALQRKIDREILRRLVGHARAIPDSFTRDELRLIWVAAAYRFRWAPEDIFGDRLSTLDLGPGSDAILPDKPGIEAAHAIASIILFGNALADPVGSGQKWLLRLRKSHRAGDINSGWIDYLLAQLPLRRGRPAKSGLE